MNNKFNVGDELASAKCPDCKFVVWTEPGQTVMCNCGRTVLDGNEVGRVSPNHGPFKPVDPRLLQQIFDYEYGDRKHNPQQSAVNAWKNR